MKFFCSTKTHSSILHFEWTSYPWMTLYPHNFVIWKIVFPWGMQILQMLTHVIMRYESTSCSNSTTTLSLRKQETLSCWWWWVRVFQYSHFPLQSRYILPLAINPLLSLKWQAHFPDLAGSICEMPSLKTQNPSASFSFKRSLCSVKEVAGSAHSSITPVLFLRQRLHFEM